MTTARPSADERYLDLVRQFPPRPIRDDRERDEALALIDRVLDRPELTESERDYLAVLGRMVEDYEHEHSTLPGASGVDVLRHLMEENHLTQRDLAPLFGGKSVISEVLGGKRRLSLNHIRALSAYFGLPADAFIDLPDEEAGP